MSLRLDLSHQQGAFDLRVVADLPHGVTGVFGPSGAGKSTLLEIVAGLRRPDQARISLDGEWLCDTTTRRWLPPHRRRIGYVFQDSRLFPHLTVSDNLDFGRRHGRAPSDDALRGNVIELLGLGALLDRRPRVLSGGERQRVAIARALLSAPRLLLLDEPCASLDWPRREELLGYLAAVCAASSVPMLYVSHSLAEIARLAGHLLLLENGRSSACGPVNELLGRLDLPGLSGADESGTVLTAQSSGSAGDGLSTYRHPAGELRLPGAPAAAGQTVRLLIRARDVSLVIGEPGQLSIRNRLAAVVLEVGRARAGLCEVLLDAAGDRLLTRVTAETVRELALEPGRQVTALIKSASLGH